MKAHILKDIFTNCIIPNGFVFDFLENNMSKDIE